MLLKNTSERYGLISIFLHWISAGGVIWLYFLGENIEHAKEDNLPREVVIDAIRFHASIALLFFVFLAARIVMHFAQKRPAPIGGHPYLNLVALLVQRLWLLMIGIQIITGPMLAWSAGWPNRIFNWVSIPSPFPERIDWLHEAVEFIHTTTPNLFWPLLVLHIGGALKHLFIDRDDVVKRMIVPPSQ